LNIVIDATAHEGRGADALEIAVPATEHIGGTVRLLRALDLVERMVVVVPPAARGGGIEVVGGIAVGAVQLAASGLFVLILAVCDRRGAHAQAFAAAVA
jgi:hypothetical protein